MDYLKERCLQPKQSAFKIFQVLFDKSFFLKDNHHKRMKIRDIKYENKSIMQICIARALVSGHLLCKRNQIQYLSKILVALIIILEYATQSPTTAVSKIGMTSLTTFQNSLKFHFSTFVQRKRCECYSFDLMPKLL